MDIVRRKLILSTIGTKRVKFYTYTAISRKVVGKKVQATIPKGNMGYHQCTLPDTIAVEPTFGAFF